MQLPHLRRLITSFAAFLLLICATSLAQAQTVSNGGFDTPAVNTFQNSPSGSGWSFSGPGGISSGTWTGSGFGVTGAHAGQFAYVPWNGTGVSLSQSINFPSAGTYMLTYAVAGREPSSGGSGDTTYTTTVSGGVLSTSGSTTSGQSFTTVSATLNIPAAGDYTLTFANTTGTDNTTFYVDSISIFQWSPTGPPATARQQHTTTLLPNGKLLVAGGFNGNSLASAELFDPATGTWSATGALVSARGNHTATLLPNGKVLVAGGANNSGSLASAELYDPATGTWSPTAGSLATARYYHTTTLLPNGKVLAAGGLGSSGYLASAELFDSATGTWSATGSLATGRYYHTTTLLANGKVLVAGGEGNGSYLASAELYDPATGTWSATGSLATARENHTATLLANGKVLVAGGFNGSSGLIASAELYDPATGAWSATTGPLATTRRFHTATLLPNGKVLVAGGSGSSGLLASAELYDPATGTWSATGSLAAARYYHTATLLPNGKVLVAEGQGSSGYLASAELYDPATATWSATGSLVSARGIHTATLLPNGKVLVAGGYGSSGYLASAELYDPATGTWSATGSLATTRKSHTATLLPNGKVLVAGGEGSSGLIASAELYDPATGTWSATGSLATARYYHTATLLPNGKVLVAGGYYTFSGPLASAELYDPATGTWSATGSLATVRYFHSATLLSNGKVLVAGGVNDSGAIASAELYDPATAAWSATGALVSARGSHSATLLPNGKVLVAGGSNNSGSPASAELFDPGTGTWSASGSLATARIYHSATLLPNGKVLVGGGSNGNSLASAELFDPATGTWSAATGQLATARQTHTATLLLNGKVLVAGGFNSSSGNSLASAELYDVGLGFAPAAQPVITTATLNSSGAVVLTGTNLRGLSSASGGNGGQDSPSNYPVVQVRRLDNDQSTFLRSDAATNTSATAFTSISMTGQPYGHYAVTAFTNGIPSVAAIVALAPNTAPTISHVVNQTINENNATSALAITVGDAETPVASLTMSGSSSNITLVPNANIVFGGSGSARTVTVTPVIGQFGSATITLTVTDAGSLTASDSFVLTVSPIPKISVSGNSVNITDGDTTPSVADGTDFGTVITIASPVTRTFTVNNTGSGSLTLGTVTISGSQASEFTVTVAPATTVAPAGSTSFQVRFTPNGSGLRSASLSFANNDSTANPFFFSIQGTGRVLLTTNDTDGDGLNDVAEFTMAALGFDWQVAQPALVTAYYNNANSAGLYTTSQVQALNVGTPLIQRNETTGQFTLTIGVLKSTNLSSFTAFPMSGSGTSTVIDGQGRLQFQFTVPDSAAFFRLQSQ